MTIIKDVHNVDTAPQCAMSMSHRSVGPKSILVLIFFLSVNFGQFWGLDGPYLALLGPLLASGLTPSTCGNPVSRWPKQIFDQNIFPDFEKMCFGFLRPKLASYGLGTMLERSGSKFCISQYQRLVKRSSGSDFMSKLVSKT